MINPLKPLEATDSSAYLAWLLNEHLGFYFPPEKHYLLAGRLISLLEKNAIPSLDALVVALKKQPAGELLRNVLDAMVIGETYFFRDSPSFDSLKTTILPKLIHASGVGKKLRVWSAATSSGQEAFSLAMLLRDLPGYGVQWHSEIFATDISDTALAQAENAIYSEFEMKRGVDDVNRARYFQRIGDEQWRASDELRQMITWGKHNALHPLETSQKFDLILCRNMLIYFDKAAKRQAVKNLRNSLVEHGVIMFARTDSIYGPEHELFSIPNCENVFGIKAEK